MSRPELGRSSGQTICPTNSASCARFRVSNTAWHRSAYATMIESDVFQSCARLGVQPVDLAGTLRDHPERVEPGIAVVVARVAGDDHGRARVEVRVPVHVPEPPEHVAVVAVPVAGDHLRPVEEVPRRELVTAPIHQLGDLVDPVDEREQPDPRELGAHRVQQRHGEPRELGHRTGDVAEQVQVRLRRTRVPERRVERHAAGGQRAPERAADVQPSAATVAASPGDPRGELLRQRPDRLPHPSEVGGGGAKEVDVFDRELAEALHRVAILPALDELSSDRLCDQLAEPLHPQQVLVAEQPLVEPREVVGLGALEEHRPPQQLGELELAHHPVQVVPLGRRSCRPPSRRTGSPPVARGCGARSRPPSAALAAASRGTRSRGRHRRRPRRTHPARAHPRAGRAWSPPRPDRAGPRTTRRTVHRTRLDARSVSRAWWRASPSGSIDRARRRGRSRRRSRASPPWRPGRRRRGGDGRTGSTRSRSSLPEGCRGSPACRLSRHLRADILPGHRTDVWDTNEAIADGLPTDSATSRPPRAARPHPGHAQRLVAACPRSRGCATVRASTRVGRGSARIRRTTTPPQGSLDRAFHGRARRAPRAVGRDREPGVPPARRPRGDGPHARRRARRAARALLHRGRRTSRSISRSVWTSPTRTRRGIGRRATPRSSVTCLARRRSRSSGATAAAFDVAARIADDVVLPPSDPGGVAHAVDLLRTACERNERDVAAIGVAMMVPVSIGRTTAEASARAEADPRFREIGSVARSASSARSSSARNG